MLGVQVGAYRILQRLGEGGMGTVWLVEHTILGRRAALKMLHPMFSDRPDISTRFFNEARAAASLSDAGIVQIFDFGHHVDGSAYIVMELLEGEPLDRRIARARISLHDALRIMRQVAGSLGTAHARGIVHRDLKPENIFLVRDAEVIGGERAKILDFGIAKLFGESKVKTHTAAMLGTPMYMSPEQCRGAGRVDERSDVYSLGCVLFQLIAGRPPFDAEGNGEIIALHLREPAPRLTSVLADVPRAVDDLVQRCLEKDPARRFSSASALAEAIRHVMASCGEDAITASKHQMATAERTTLSASAVSLAKARPARRVSIVTVVITSAFVLSTAFAALVLRYAPRTEGHSTEHSSHSPPVQPTEQTPASQISSQLTTTPPLRAPETVPAPAEAGPASQEVAATPPASPPSDGRHIEKRQTARANDADASQEVVKPAARGTDRAPAHGRPTSVQRKDLRSTDQTAEAKPSPETVAVKADTSLKQPEEAPGGLPTPIAPLPDSAAPPPAASRRPAVPTPTEPLANNVPEKLDKTLIAAGMAPVRKRIMGCGAPFVGSRVGVSVTVSPTGDVSNVTVENSPDLWLDNCLTTSIKMTRFATTLRGGVFRQRFTF